MAADPTFTQTTLRAVKKPVHRLGLALSFGLEPDGVSAALDRGLNYVFYTRSRTAQALPPLRAALARDRERFVVATGPTLGYFRFNLRSGVEAALRRLGTDYLDVLMLYWLGKTSALTDSNVEEILRLKAEGKIRAVGASIHDRPRAGRLAEDSALDLLMVRYNAAHPGAERDIFPHLGARQPSIVAYTATSWRKLLRAPRGWSGPVMRAGDCYRFCLSNPNVEVVLTGPSSRKELEENLTVLDQGPLTPDESEWMRKFGAAVHG